MTTVKSLFMIGILVVVSMSRAEDEVKFRVVAEFGFLNVLSRKVQFGKNGTYFDYVENGGQDVLLPVTRFSTEMDVGKKNTFIILCQPFKVNFKNHDYLPETSSTV